LNIINTQDLFLASRKYHLPRTISSNRSI